MRYLILLTLLSTLHPSLLLGQIAPRGTDYGWLADGRRFAVGDIITVVVDEFTSASADRRTDAVEDRSTDASVLLRNGTSNSGADLGSFLGNQSTRRGRDIRQDRITSEVSVRVTEVQPGGALSVEGRKVLVIDEHEQEVTVRGTIRPQDITSGNTVDSWRIADAEVLYATDGTLGRPDKGIIARLLGWIVP